MDFILSKLICITKLSFKLRCKGYVYLDIRYKKNILLKTHCITKQNFEPIFYVSLHWKTLISVFTMFVVCYNFSKNGSNVIKCYNKI